MDYNNFGVVAAVFVFGWDSRENGLKEKTDKKIRINLKWKFFIWRDQQCNLNTNILRPNLVFNSSHVEFEIQSIHDVNSILYGEQERCVMAWSQTISFFFSAL